MSTISLRLPQSIHDRVRELAKREGVSINQLINSAVAEKVSAFLTRDYLEERAQKGSRAKFERALSMVRDSEPEHDDRLDA